MVDFVISKEVNHKLNKEYVCLLVQFRPDDKHFYKDKMNYMPTDDEVIKLVSLMINISPTFKNKFKEVFL